MEAISGLNITNSALPVYQVNNVGLAGANLTVSAVEVWNTAAGTYGVSLSSGNVKASPGVLMGYFPTTSGDMEFKDGNTSVFRVAIVAGTVSNIPPIRFLTSISLSASAAVATLIYR